MVRTKSEILYAKFFVEVQDSDSYFQNYYIQNSKFLKTGHLST